LLDSSASRAIFTSKAENGGNAYTDERLSACAPARLATSICRSKSLYESDGSARNSVGSYCINSPKLGYPNDLRPDLYPHSEAETRSEGAAA
jgi:hypothetical protein